MNKMRKFFLICCCLCFCFMVKADQWMTCDNPGCGRNFRGSDLKEIGDFSQGHYCPRAECQAYKRSVSRRRIATAGIALQVGMAIMKQNEQKTAALEKLWDEFVFYVKTARANHIPAEKQIAMYDKFRKQILELKADITLKKLIEITRKHLNVIVLPNTPNDAFWCVLVHCGNLDVIRHYWPKATTAREYEKFYPKADNALPAKTGISPLAVGSDLTFDTILFCNSVSAAVVISAFEADDPICLAYLMEQCSPNSDFMFYLLSRADNLHSDDERDIKILRNDIKENRGRLEFTTGNIERKKLAKTIAEDEKKLNDIVTAYEKSSPVCWNLLIAKATPYAFVNFMPRKDLNCPYGVAYRNGCRVSKFDFDGDFFSKDKCWYFSGPANTERTAILRKRMLNTPCLQLELYKKHQNFTFGIDPCHLMIRNYRNLGDRNNPVIVNLLDGYPHPYFSGFSSKNGKWVWTPGQKHLSMPYKAGTLKNEWIWLPDQESPMMPGYRTGKEENNWVWSAGLIHPDNPSLISGSQLNHWITLPGFAAAKADSLPVWTSNVKHPRYPHVVSGKKIYMWNPEDGYQWKKPDDPKNYQVIKNTK